MTDEPQPTPAADQRVLDLMREVAELVDRIGTKRGERIWHELEILALFDRCRSLHRGVPRAADRSLTRRVQAFLQTFEIATKLTFRNFQWTLRGDSHHPADLHIDHDV